MSSEAAIIQTNNPGQVPFSQDLPIPVVLRRGR